MLDALRACIPYHIHVEPASACGRVLWCDLLSRVASGDLGAACLLWLRRDWHWGSGDDDETPRNENLTTG